MTIVSFVCCSAFVKAPSRAYAFNRVYSLKSPLAIQALAPKNGVLTPRGASDMITADCRAENALFLILRYESFKESAK